MSFADRITSTAECLSCGRLIDFRKAEVLRAPKKREEIEFSHITFEDLMFAFHPDKVPNT